MSIRPNSLTIFDDLVRLFENSLRSGRYPLALTPSAAISASVALPFSSMARTVNATSAPSLGEFQCDGFADAAGRARYDNVFSFE